MKEIIGGSSAFGRFVSGIDFGFGAASGFGFVDLVFAVSLGCGWLFHSLENFYFVIQGSIFKIFFKFL